jgi:hypothetical protein
VHEGPAKGVLEVRIRDRAPSHLYDAIMTLPANSKERLLEKAVEAIQISLVVGELTLLQRKILNVLLEYAKPYLLVREVHEVRFRDIIDRLGYNSNDYKPIKQALEELPTRRVRWNYLGTPGGKDYGVSGYIAQVEFIGDKIQYAYPPKIREMLHSPQRFAVLNLRIQNEFSRQYTLPLYEVLKQFVEFGETRVFSVNEWKELLGVPCSTVYDEFKHFNNKVLKPALQEINNSSDIIASTYFFRRGKYISQIRFRVEMKPQISLSLPVPRLKSDLLDRITALGCSENQAEKFLQVYPNDYLIGNLALVEEGYANGKIKKPGAYLAKALKEDFRPKETRLERARREQRDTAERITQSRVAMVELVERYLHDRLRRTKEHIDCLSEDERVLIQEDFGLSLRQRDRMLNDLYRRSGLRSPVVRSLFYEFCAERFGFKRSEEHFREFCKKIGTSLELGVSLPQEAAIALAAG